MRVAIVGATGNVGTSLLRALADEPAVDEIVGIARRLPLVPMPKTRWVAADVTTSPLVEHLRGCDAVVHLAWAIQPARSQDVVERINIEGSRRVFEATAAADVPVLVYASSVGAYGPGPKDRLVDESWPVEGIPSSFYSRHKAAVEKILDRFEEANPRIRSVRLRPALIFKKAAAAEVRRLFLGPLLPGWLLRRSLIPVVPDMDRLVFQAVHSFDAGQAYRAALVQDVSGAFNIAADPVLDPDRLAALLGARKMPLPPQVLRNAFAVSWRLRMQPSPPGWIDLALQSPLLDSGRARSVLGWRPQQSSEEALLDLMEGLRTAAGAPTPPLEPKAGGFLRWREFKTGIGTQG